MSQKDKVKELVGRSLNSYHTKALQQIDRIEKKNKEQNHKISILSNELDNDYLTKTEEGSVVSLEHSKEGMVYLDELQGNTLVNYCTDGSKEITLNGDIDVEGTFVTTTEGVDNGKVDVMCEGNTLVNLATYGHKYQISVGGNNVTAQDVFTMTEQTVKTLKGTIDKNLSESGASYIYFQLGRLNMGLLKPNTTYTILLDSKTDFLSNISIQEGNTSNKHSLTSSKVNKNTFVITTKSSFDGLDSKNNLIYGHYVTTYKGDVDVSVIAVLEGDYSNKPIPLHFEGMKSVGQDGENSHKIEILSRKSRENLLIGGGFEVRATKDSYADMRNPIKIDPNLDLQSLINKTLLLSVYKHTEGEGQKNPTVDGILGKRFGIHGTIRWGKSGDVNSETSTYPLVLVDNDWGYINTIQYKVEKITPPVGYDTIKSFNISFQPNSKPSENNDATWILKNAKLEIVESTTDTPSEWCPHLSEDTTYQYHNKKEILINEPLRSLPNGIKDRMVKIGGKYFIERNLYGITLNGNSNENWIIGFTDFGTPIFSWNKTGINIYKSESYYSVLSDRFIYARQYSQTETDYKCIYVYNYGDVNEQSIRIQYPLNSVEEFRNYLSANPIDVIIRLETPTYEPLEIEPTLLTYNNIAHISNNSIIPCNMKIQNTGYNAIIKPNTLYTVALDTNKSGTIGLNLGGAKVTTTNNIATITTPATLADDSLRLYGKGINGSKVRLIEGDKTNWIPSFFEGMKSSFEDKVQEDGNYTMKILSNNKNIMDVPNINCLSKVKGCWWNLEGTNSSMYNDINKKTKLCFFAEKGKSYIITFDYKNLATIQRLEYQNQEKIISLAESNLTNGKGKLRIIGDGKVSTFRLKSQIEDGSTPTEVTNFMVIEEGVYSDKFIKNEQNKIQFSSIEPLRSTKDISDRFIFKDGKIMIERNCIERDLTYFKFSTTEIKGLNLKGGIPISDAYRQPQGGANTKIKCDKLASDFKEDIIPCINIYHHANQNELRVSIPQRLLKTIDKNGINDYFANNPHKVIYRLAEPYYEEIPHELQKIILEGYENGTLFLDTNIPPTVTVTYAGETPIARATKINKTEVSNNTADINDNILPYLMDMDYRIVMLQLENEMEDVSLARIFNGAYEMLKRDILSKRLTKEEYRHRTADYLMAGKINKEQYLELEKIIYE